MAALCEPLGETLFSSSLCVVGRTQMDQRCHLLNHEASERPDLKFRGGDFCVITEVQLEAVSIASHHLDRPADSNTFMGEGFISFHRFREFSPSWWVPLTLSPW